jgi:hypothetical protein
MKWQANPKVWIAACSAMSAFAGAAVGFVVAKKALENKFQEQLAAEVADARSYFQQMYSTPTFVAEEPALDEDDVVHLEAVREATEEIDGIPADLVGDALSAQRSYDADDYAAEPGDTRVPAPVIVNNIFQNATQAGDAVLDALMKDRDPNFPYIITKEEFYQNDQDFEQKKFTYWEGDDILADDQEELNPIEDVERVAGEDNLRRFGYGSGDEHVLYIRNETLDPPMDLHITRSTGRYAVEVMALDDDEPHLQHSIPRRFRTRDE